MQPCVARTPVRAIASTRSLAASSKVVTSARTRVTFLIPCSRNYATATPKPLVAFGSSAIPPPIITARSSRLESTSTANSIPLQKAADKAKATSSNSTLQHAHLLTAIHRARELLPRILPPESKELKFWSSVLRDTADELSGIEAVVSGSPSSAKRLKVVVYGVDEFASAEALVSALLEDPFATEQEVEAVKQRWDGRDDKVVIEYGSGFSGIENSSRDNDADTEPVHLTSSFLNAFHEPVQLTELRTSTQLSEDKLRELYTADIPIVVVNPLSTPLSSLYPSSNPHAASTHSPRSSAGSPIFPYPIPPHAIVVLTTSPPVPTFTPSQPTTSAWIPSSLQDSIASLLPQTSDQFVFSTQQRESLATTLASRLLLIDSPRALQASRTFRASPSSPYAVDRYQSDTLASGISALGRAISSQLLPASSSESSTSKKSQDALAAAHAFRAKALLTSALSMMEQEIASAKQDVRHAKDVVWSLQEAVKRAKVEVDTGVFGHSIIAQEAVSSSTDGILGESSVVTRNDAHKAKGEDKVEVALKKAENAIRPILDGLSWWRVLARSDEVSWLVRGSVRAAWASEVERVVLPALSTLPSIQKTLTDMTQSRLNELSTPKPSSTSSSHRQSALHSAVLHNKLAQLISSPTYPVVPTTLLQPLSTRREQLENQPTIRLERAAQELVARTFFSGILSLGATTSWFAWHSGADILTGSKLGMYMTPLELASSLMGDSFATAMAIGGLVGSLCLRVVAGKYEKERRAWWDDFRRVAEGASRDMKTELDKTMDSQVSIVPITACEGIDELVQRRQEEVETLQDEVARLGDTLRESVTK